VPDADHPVRRARGDLGNQVAAREADIASAAASLESTPRD
jgi:hypothetical protein